MQSRLKDEFSSTFLVVHFSTCCEQNVKQPEKVTELVISMIITIVSSVSYTRLLSRTSFWRVSTVRVLHNLQELLHLNKNYNLSSPLLELYVIIIKMNAIVCKTPWRNGSASDSRSEGCVFESRRGHMFFIYLYRIQSRKGSVFDIQIFWTIFPSDFLETFKKDEKPNFLNKIAQHHLLRLYRCFLRFLAKNNQQIRLEKVFRFDE